MLSLLVVPFLAKFGGLIPLPLQAARFVSGSKSPLLITHYSLLITHYSLLITHYSLLITHYSLLITYFLSNP
jgi:hypothetical protein